MGAQGPAEWCSRPHSMAYMGSLDLRVYVYASARVSHHATSDIRGQMPPTLQCRVSGQASGGGHQAIMHATPHMDHELATPTPSSEPDQRLAAPKCAHWSAPLQTYSVFARRFRAKREQLETFPGLLPEIHGHNIILAAFDRQRPRQNNDLGHHFFALDGTVLSNCVNNESVSQTSLHQSYTSKNPSAASEDGVRME